MSIVDDIKKQIKELNAKLVEIQTECVHPLSTRQTKNKGASGNYDDPEGTYWTEHSCGLCEKYWHTDQNWKHKDDGKGLPTQ
jgi:hypothetical protein